MKSGKRHLTDGMELPNQSKIRTLGENETYKYLGILEAITKGRNTQVVSLVRYSRLFLKWTTELIQMEQRTRELMTMYNTLHPRD